MNKPLRKVALALAVLFAILLVNANVVQVVNAHSLTSNSHNRRVLIDDYRRQRGDIIAGGQVVAQSVATSDKLKYLRTYPGGSLFAPITGYDSLTLGTTGIESSQDSILSGDDSRLSISFDRLSQMLTGRTVRGGSVSLTIDSAAQTVAAKALSDRKGAVVAIDPRTGAILAMVSSPSYDPSQLTGHDPTMISKNYKALQADPNKPLLNRATSESYPPGSTFKVIVTAAALASGKYQPDTQVPAPATYPLPGTTVAINNFEGESCDGTSITLAHALEISCNTAYAGIGVALGADALRAQARAFGFGTAPSDVGVPTAASVFPDNLNIPQTAQSSIGQFDVRATPLQMAMVAAAIANGGSMMKPYLVQQVTGPDLKVLARTIPTVLGTPVNGTVAGELTTMMEAVVNSGTGTSAQIPGVRVAGKTGTAETGISGQQPDSWFIGFAPAGAPTVAIAVLVENGGTGGAVAAPIARQVLAQILADQK